MSSQSSGLSARRVLDMLRHGLGAPLIVLALLAMVVVPLAAPVLDARGHVCAVLTALGASNGFDARPGGRICPQIIREAQDISAEKLASKPFAHLPVLGVPGWWPANEEPAFYADTSVFRAARPLGSPP